MNRERIPHPARAAMLVIKVQISTGIEAWVTLRRTLQESTPSLIEVGPLRRRQRQGGWRLSKIVPPSVLLCAKKNPDGFEETTYPNEG